MFCIFFVQKITSLRSYMLPAYSSVCALILKILGNISANKNGFFCLHGVIQVKLLRWLRFLDYYLVRELRISIQGACILENWEHRFQTEVTHLGTLLGGRDSKKLLASSKSMLDRWTTEPSLGTFKLLHWELLGVIKPCLALMFRICERRLIEVTTIESFITIHLVQNIISLIELLRWF